MSRRDSSLEEVAMRSWMREFPAPPNAVIRVPRWDEEGEADGVGVGVVVVGEGYGEECAGEGPGFWWSGEDLLSWMGILKRRWIAFMTY
jgi:hypothetical protein